MAVLILIFVLAGAVRLFQLGAISLWHDEAFSVLLSRMSFLEMTYRTGLDVHPPFYYYLLKIWSFVFGQSIFAFRAMSVFFSVLALVFVYLLLRELKIRKYLNIFILLTLTLSPFQIQYAQEMRMYSLGAFLIIASAYFLIKLFKKFSWLNFAIYSLLIIASLYTHYYLFFSVFAQAIIALIYKNKKIFLSYILAGLAFLPWLPVFISQNKQVQEAYWIPKPSWSSVPNTFLRLILGSNASIEHHYILYSLLILASLFFIIWGLIKFNNKFKWLLLSLFLTPFILALLLSFKTAIFLDRYFIFVQAFYYILILLGMSQFKKRIAIGLIMFFLAFNLYSLVDYKESLDLKNRPGMKAAAEYINRNYQEGDKIFVGSSFVFFNFQYYNKTGEKPLLYAPGELLHFSGTALLDKDDIIKEFSEFVGAGLKPASAIWMINTTGFGNWQPEVPKTWQKIEEKAWEDTQNRGWIICSKFGP
ncbi:MAG: glycosyltransferase family 39 protein [bacterium]